MAVDRIRIIGIGEDGPAGLTPRALRLVEEAELLAGGERHLAFFPDHPAERLVIKSNLAEVAGRLAECLGRRRAVVLASGDPNFYGIARYLTGKLSRRRVEIVPNVSSMQLAFARVGLPWDDAWLASVHGRPVADVVEGVRRHPKVGLFTDDRHTPAAVARALLAAGVADRAAYVCENLGGADERVTETSLSRLAAGGADFSPLNVLILAGEAEPAAAGGTEPAAGLAGEPAAAAGGPVAAGTGGPVAAGTGGPVERAAALWGLGLPEGAFHQRKPRRGLITKTEVRVLSLARMNLRRDSIVWDIGAGTGAVGIEAARLAPEGRVYAIEKNAADMDNIRRNIARFGVGNMEAVQGVAPAGLEAFPDPDAVFIGGSGGRMEGILEEVCRRLRPGGRVVLNAATLENLAEADRLLRRRGWERDVTLVQIARSRPVAAGRGIEGGEELSLTRLASLDPVFIITAWRPGEGLPDDLFIEEGGR